MKKVIYITCLTIIAFLSQAQQWKSNGANIYYDKGDLELRGLNTNRYLRFSEYRFQGGFIGYDGVNNILNIGVNENGDANADYKAISILRSNGNVGIGTSVPFQSSGNYGLHIDRGHHSSLLLGNPINGYGGIIQTSDNRERVFIGANLYDDQKESWKVFKQGKGAAGISILADKGDWGNSINFYISDKDRIESKMILNSKGYLGIGIDIPDEKLVINEGNIKVYGLNVNRYLRFSEGRFQGGFIGYDGVNNILNIGVNEKGDANADYKAISIQRSSGHVGIGTTSTPHKLTVNGSIGAKKISVRVNGWKDFVFYDSYKLRKLEEVESYIAKNKHLPEVPSEAEVCEKGIDLGDMDATLLQKIEELTLYLIEQNKTLKKQNEKIQHLEEELNKLKSK